MGSNSEGQESNKKNTKQIILRVLNIIIATGFGAFLVYYLLKGGDVDINISDIKQALLNMYKPTLIAGLAIMLLSNLFRAYRKNILVGSDRIGMGDMFLVAMIRNAFNMVLPARTGELSYVYVLTRRFMFPLEIGVSTLMVVMVFDLVIVFSLIVISIVIVGINTYAISSVLVVIIAAALLIGSLLILFFLSDIIGFFIMIYKKLLKRFKVSEKKMIHRIYNKILDINNNLKLIRGRKIYWKVYLSSIAARLFKYTSYYLIIHAILSPLGYSFSDLNYWAILLATMAAEISAVLPTHAFAGLGTYEYSFIWVLVFLGFDEKISKIVGFSYHFITLSFTVILGIIAMIIISLPFYRIKKNGLEENK